MPFEFANITLFESQHGPRSSVESDQQLRVGQGAAESGQLLFGVWDQRQARLIVPCTYRRVWRVMLSPGDSHGYLVVRSTQDAEAKTFGKHAMQLLKDTGEPMFPFEFAWIGRKLDPERYGAMEQLREALYTAWATGRPVPAAVGKKGPERRLKRDGTWQ